MSSGGEKTKATGVRIPTDLLAHLEEVKAKQAHKRVPNSALLIEAISLYVKLAARYGLDEDLHPKCTYSPSEEHDAKYHELRRPKSA